jgi:hypothetical protein
VLDSWVFVHAAVGVVLAISVPLSVKECADSVLFPLAGVLVGLSFAWAGNAQALLQSSELQDLSSYHPGGFAHYVFTFQTAILVLLVTLVLWAIGGLSLFDCIWPTPKDRIMYHLVKLTLFALSSLSIRECWHVVLGAQWMLLAQATIKKAKKENSVPPDSNPPSGTSSRGTVEDGDSCH